MIILTRRTARLLPAWVAEEEEGVVVVVAAEAVEPAMLAVSVSCIWFTLWPPRPFPLLQQSRA